MDYYFVDPQNINNLSKKSGTVDFNFVPQEDVNFFEASLIFKLDYSISKKNPALEFPAGTAVPSIVHYFIYGLINDATVTSNKVRIARQENVYDYVRTSQIFKNDPRDSIYGLKYMLCKDYECKDSLYFNVPLRFLFSEFIGLNYVDSETKNLNIKLKEVDFNVFDEHNTLLNFDYSFKSIILKVPKFISNTEIKENPGIVWQSNSNCQSIDALVKAGRGDIDCILSSDRPLSFVCMFKDNMNEIKSGIKSVRLMINNELIPSMDSDEECALEHYYEMYLRYIEYGDDDNVYKHKKNMNVMDLYQFKRNPIFFFILPKLREVGQYSIKVKVVFESGLNKIHTISQIYYRSNFITEQGRY